MLKLFRKKIVMKIILWGLVIIVVPAFVMWGGASMSRSKDKGPDYVGTLNGRKVSFDELYAALSGVRSQVILGYFNQPKVLDTLLGNKPLLAKLAWDRIIMLDQAKKLKIKISDKEVIEAIRTHPLFLRDGVFDDRFYAYMLRNNIGLEPREFEEMIRENISLQKLGAIIAKDVKVSDQDTADEYKKEFEKIKISYLIVEPKRFIDKVNVEESAVKDFYEKNKNDLAVRSNLRGMVPDRQATFEESKATIANFMKEAEAGKLLPKESEDIRKRITDRMANYREKFASAAEKTGFIVKDSQFLSRADKLDDIGDAARVVEAGTNLKDSEVSKPLEVKNGYIIFEIIGRQGIDEEKFKKDKEEYAKKVHEMKSNIIMEEWLRKLEEKASLVIKLEEIEKYYK